jgi:hypothetical protein
MITAADLLLYLKEDTAVQTYTCEPVRREDVYARVGECSVFQGLQFACREGFEEMLGTTGVCNDDAVAIRACADDKKCLK